MFRWTEQGDGRFHHNTQNDVQFKTYGFISSIFLLFLDHSSPRGTESVERKTTDKGDYCI